MQVLLGGVSDTRRMSAGHTHDRVHTEPGPALRPGTHPVHGGRGVSQGQGNTGPGRTEIQLRAGGNADQGRNTNGPGRTHIQFRTDRIPGQGPGHHRNRVSHTTATAHQGTRTTGGDGCRRNTQRHRAQRGRRHRTHRTPRVGRHTTERGRHLKAERARRPRGTRRTPPAGRHAM